MELRCSRDLALWLGAAEPQTTDEHKEMKKAGHLLVRDNTGYPIVLFWPWISPLIATMWRTK